MVCVIAQGRKLDNPDGKMSHSQSSGKTVPIFVGPSNVKVIVPVTQTSSRRVPPSTVAYGHYKRLNIVVLIFHDRDS